MAEHTPNWLPSDRLPRTTSATVTGGQYLVVSGSDTVAPSGGASTAGLGVAANDAASGAQVVVYTVGVHTLTASGAIPAGAPVIPAAAGAVADLAAGTNYAQIVGTALSAAAGGKVLVKLGR